VLLYSGTAKSATPSSAVQRGTSTGGRLVAYARSKIDCEASRARELYTLERDSPWLKATLEECRAAVPDDADPALGGPAG
jgi:hypothetical protein